MRERTKARIYLPAIGASLLAAVPALAAEGESNIFSGDLGNAVWTVVVFGVVLFVLGRWAWGPLLDRLQQREQFIRESLETAKREREEAEARLKQYEEKLARARAEATAIVEEGRRDGGVVRQRIEEEAREEAQRLIARARREIELATETAIQELYSRAARLATEAASQIIAKELDPEDHQRLVAESIARLEAAETQ